ncbi:MAG: KilA-N domain-containing protein [Bacteroidetes bacterium]|nr:KilA-N domain-containing protein [Bacteroidota bacterium]
MSKVTVEGADIHVIELNDSEFISLTDIVKKYDDDQILYRWMRSRNTLEFLGVWEQVYNPDFNTTEFDRFRFESGLNTFSMSPKKWIDGTNAIGIISKSGRYGGGTYAHKDIALEFCSWISPVFRFYMIREFQRLKEDEARQQSLEWDVKRIMAKASYPIHTEAVRQHLIPPKIARTKQEGLYFANEADLLNVALFGISAKEWKLQNPEAKGNIRDSATHEQLLVLSLLQGLNAKLMEWGSDARQRLELLNKAAIDWMEVILESSSLKELPGEGKKLKGGVG